MTQIASEGQILVSSTTEKQPTKTGHDQESSPAQKRGASARKEEGQVSQALRTVYQRAVDEDIPAEMLDLLSKLD